MKEQDRYRVLRSESGIDFTSNDYLGFASHPALREAIGTALAQGVATGSGGSRLLRGNSVHHEDLEEFAANFFSRESALYFNSGFDANLALFSSLASRHDAIIIDEKIHASVKEGAHASLAKKYTARHNDVHSFQEKISHARLGGAKEIFIAVESIYSMDGDRAPLEELFSLANDQECVMVVDEAHATGIFGKDGRGCTEKISDENSIVLHTCSKALGASGAILTSSRAVKEYLINTARPFIYSTASSPLMAIAAKRALELTREETWRRTKLLDLARFSRESFSREMNIGETCSQIIPVIIGTDQEAVRVAGELQKRGFDVRAIRPPTVPEGSARLRISITVNRTEDEISSLGKEILSIIK